MNKQVLVLNNKYGLRKEKHNISLIKTNDVESIELVKAIHPSHAIILALFDGKKTVKDIYENYRYLFNGNMNYKQFLKSHILPFIKEKVLVNTSEQTANNTKKYKPEEFIIPREDINLAHIRVTTPLEIVWHLTEECICNCVYCYNQRPLFTKETLLSLERIFNLAHEIVELKVNDVQFSGGDPLLHPLIFDLLKLLCNNEIRVYLSTKFYINEIFVDKLLNTGLKVIQLSIDAIDQKQCKIMNRVERHGIRTLKSIMLLKKKGMRVHTNTVVTELNFSNIPDLIEKLADCGVDRISISQYGRSLYRHKEFLFLNATRKKQLLESIARYRAQQIPVFFSGMDDPNTLSSAEKRKLFLKRSRCGGLFYGCVINPDGKLSICEQLPIDSPFRWGNLHNQTLASAWNDPDFFKILYPSRELFKGRVCYTCREFAECTSRTGRCVRNALQAYQDYWAPDPRCPLAPAGQRII